MEQYIVSARKYRPSSFATVVGQEALTSTLKNAIATDHLAHAYLFCGSRGVGKTSCARIFAKTINCSNITADGEACNECESCRSFNEGVSMNIIEFDAASNNGVDDIKKIIDQVHIPPARGRYRVFIIDEVHMLSNQAFNAFLKTLEEPPSYVIFILATTEKHKIIPTILSRCQIYDFSRISINDMVAHMQSVAANEGITAEESALSVIAHQADGAMRDALSIFDQVAASCRGNITYDRTIEALNVLDSSYYNRLLDCIVAGDIPGELLIFNEIRAKGFDGQFFISGLCEYFRSLMLAGNERTHSLLDEPDDIKATLVEAAAKVKPDFIYGALNICNDTDLNYRLSSSKQMLVELALIKITQLLHPSPVIEPTVAPLRPISVNPSQQAAPQAPAAPASTAAPVAPATHAPATHAPASIPTRPAAPAPRPAGSPKISLGRVTMTNTPATAAAPTATSTATATNIPITAESLAKAWNTYIDTCSAEPAVVNSMRNNLPKADASGKYILLVDNDLSGSRINEHRSDIVNFVRNATGNATFDLEVRVIDSGPQPMFWNENQVLTYMLDNHPNFREFYNNYKLSKI